MNSIEQKNQDFCANYVPEYTLCSKSESHVLSVKLVSLLAPLCSSPLEFQFTLQLESSVSLAKGLVT
jgi:hypothetical protein